MIILIYMCIQGLGTPTTSQHISDSEKLTNFSCAPDTSERVRTSSLDVKSDALPIEPSRHAFMNQLNNKWSGKEYTINLTNVIGTDNANVHKLFAFPIINLSSTEDHSMSNKAIGHRYYTCPFFGYSNRM